MTEPTDTESSSTTPTTNRRRSRRRRWRRRSDRHRERRDIRADLRDVEPHASWRELYAQQDSSTSIEPAPKADVCVNHSCHNVDDLRAVKMGTETRVLCPECQARATRTGGDRAVATDGGRLAGDADDGESPGDDRSGGPPADVRLPASPDAGWEEHFAPGWRFR